MILLSLLGLFSLISLFLRISFWSFLNGFQINGPSSTLSKSLNCFLVIFFFYFIRVLVSFGGIFLMFLFWIFFSIYLIKRAISTPLRWAVFFLDDFWWWSVKLTINEEKLSLIVKKTGCRYVLSLNRSGWHNNEVRFLNKIN